MVGTTTRPVLNVQDGLTTVPDKVVVSKSGRLVEEIEKSSSVLLPQDPIKNKEQMVKNFKSHIYFIIFSLEINFHLVC